MTPPSARVDIGAVSVFALTSIGLAWLVALPLWLRGEGLSDPLLGVFATAMMLTPALATLAALLVQRRVRSRGVRAVLRDLGVWPLRPLGRTIGFSVAGIIAMPLLIVAGLTITAALGLAVLDPVTFSGFSEMLQASVPTDAPLPPAQVLAILQIAMIPLGAVINAPFAFGEEVGWRGWLLPALRPLGVWPSLLLSGAFWGLWHSPLVLLGYNFAQPDAFGVVLMVVACTLFGVILGWMRLRTGSVWPAVFAHGAFNAAAGLGALVVAAGSPIPPAAVAGPLGVIMWGVFAAVIALLVLSGQLRGRRVRAELGPDPARTQRPVAAAPG